MCLDYQVYPLVNATAMSLKQISTLRLLLPNHMTHILCEWYKMFLCKNNSEIKNHEFWISIFSGNVCLNVMR